MIIVYASSDIKFGSDPVPHWEIRPEIQALYLQHEYKFLLISLDPEHWQRANGKKYMVTKIDQPYYWVNHSSLIEALPAWYNRIPFQSSWS